jgi:proliferating cell nuclear antigen PCNA
MKIVVRHQENVNKLSTIFKNLKIFTDNLVIYLDEIKGLYIQGMDRSHCCICEIRIIPQWFDVFEYNKNIDMPTLGLHTIILQKIMNTYTEGQTIELSTNGETDKLSIVFSETEKVLNKYFEIPLINIEIDILAITDENKQVDLTLDTKVFVNLVNQMQIFDDILILKFTENTIDISSEGDEGEMKVSVSLDDVVEYEIEEQLELQQRYSIPFIQMMCAFNKLSTEFVMRFDSDRPMDGKYILGENSYICFFVAPKMDDD